MSKVPAIFHRVELVTGHEGYHALREARVIIFGIGGVGSWCAEALVRSGVGHVTLVDSDRVCMTNINRQRQANRSTVGDVKVEALKKELLLINPQADIEALEMIYGSETDHLFDFNSYDYVIDAIDSLASKKLLIERAIASSATLFSSMGAACKVDPTRIKVAPIFKSYGCPLAKLIRKHLQQQKLRSTFKVVFSDELLENHEGDLACGSKSCVCPKGPQGEEYHEWCSSKKQINGSLVHITAIFGMQLAGLVMKDLLEKNGALKVKR